MTGVDISLDYAGLAYGPGGPVLLLAALVLDAVFGVWPGLRRRIPHPALVMAGLVAELSRRLNRKTRSPSARLIRGLILLFIVVGSAVLIGLALELLSRLLPFFWLFLLLLITALTVLRGPFDEAGRVTTGFANKALPGARAAAAEVIGPKAAEMPPGDLVRALLEHLSGRLADGLAAGVFWYLLLGLPGLLALRAINIAGRLLDEAKPDIAIFGFAPTRLNEAVGLLPALLAGTAIALAAVFVPGCNPSTAFASMIGGGLRSGPGNLRLSEAPAIAAFMGALGVSGPGGPGGRVLDGASGAEIVRGQYLYAVAGLLIFALIVVLSALRYAV